MTDPLPPPRMRVMWVDNHDDPRNTVKYLHDLAVYRQLAHQDHDYGRIVVRPTPGTGGTRASVAIDLLTAIGKNPDVLRDERLTTCAWDLARAWLAGSRITDVVIDRAHQLPTERLVDLAGLATAVDATLWPVWSTLDTEGAHLAVKTLTAAGYQVKRMRPAMMEAVWLPPPGSWLDANSSAAPQTQWPILPTADFTTFRAAARRHLSPRAFARVDALYQDAAARTDQWITSHRDRYELLPPALVDIGPALVAWLRDEQLGAAPDPAAALITLRATQAPLFLHGILLRWTPDTLGPDPAGRLLGDLTTIVTRAITAMGRTDHAAATALSLHLNQSPVHFTCFRCGDITDDGTRLTGPPGHRHPTTPGHDLRMLGSGGVREVPCETAIRLPMHARAVLAAHLAYRRGQGARDDDPLFVHPTKPGQPPRDSLREGVIRTSRRLNLNPPWMHRSHCKHGTDIGIQPRTQGWMTERGLTLFQLDRYVAARVPRRPGEHR